MRPGAKVAMQDVETAPGALRVCTDATGNRACHSPLGGRRRRCGLTAEWDDGADRRRDSNRLTSSRAGDAGCVDPLVINTVSSGIQNPTPRPPFERSYTFVAKLTRLSANRVSRGEKLHLET